MSKLYDLTRPLLSGADQAAVGRALENRPAQRSASVGDDVKPPEDAATDPPGDHAAPPALPAIIAACGGGAQLDPASAQPSTTLHQFIMELVTVAAGNSQWVESGAIRYRVEPGRTLEHRCSVQLFPGAMSLRLEGFQQQWNAKGVQQKPGHYCFIVNLRPDFWRRLTGRPLGLEIEIQLRAARRGPSRPREVAVVVRPFGCNRAQATRLLNETGPAVLESIRDYLQAFPEQRSQGRLAISQPLRVSPVLRDMHLAQPIECRGKDVSMQGIGFFLPHVPSTPQVYINLPEVPRLASLAGLAQIVRGQPCGDGWYEIGAFFASDGPGNEQAARTEPGF